MHGIIRENLHILCCEVIAVKTWKIYGFWILLTEAVGALAGWLTRNSIRLYSEMVVKPSLSPPDIVFPIVWSILYALMGIGAAQVWRMPGSEARSRSLLLFLVQLTVNFFWSLIFFNLQAFGFALIWLILLWLLILGMILSFRKVDPFAALLQIPYFIWVSFAIYLNAGVWLLNR